MAILSIFSASYCNGDEIVNELSANLGWKRLDGEVIAAAAEKYGAEPKNYLRAMEGPPFVFNKFTRRREKTLAQLKLTLAQALSDGQILYGYASHLIPADIGHVLRVCLIADSAWRAVNLRNSEGKEIDDAARRLRAEDMKNAQWTQFLHKKTPWDKSLYDLVIMVSDSGIDGAVKLIRENAQKPAVAYSESSLRSLEDFLIASRCELALIEGGLHHSVSCSGGAVTVIVDEYVVLMERLENEIRKILAPVKGLKEVHVKPGPHCRPPSVFANIEVDMPEKVLLVDDEKDFVTTLSERLEMRDLEPAVVYSGEEALNLLEEEAPEVMVLDLRMPGIDGIEVLRKVRSEYPDVAVIILTGHGTDRDRELCLSLGAFAYLEKPVDIDQLAGTMKRAKEYRKSRAQKE
ncbi:MAG: response regulator [Acidobacteria bacterium]|nr:response regulator [Acidobacteriota bacterium]